MLRCKFKLTDIVKSDQGRQVKLTACNTTEGDNEDWSKYTPSGNLDFYVTNEAAFEKIDAMKIGDPYYIDIAPVQ